MRLFRQFPAASRPLTLMVLLSGMSAAQAQLSGSAGLLSNYLYRGISLSSEQPAARLALNYDANSGWYGGTQVVNGQLAGTTQRQLHWTTYAGYAQRLAGGLAWEAGVSQYGFAHQASWNFHEFYGGLAGDNLNARLYYSPDYLGLGQRTWFAEVNGGWRLAADWQGFWQGGYLYAPGQAQTNRVVARIGVVAHYQQWQAQLSIDSTRLRAPGASTLYGIGSASGSSDPAWRQRLALTLVRRF